MKGHTSGLAHSQFQPYYKLQLDFYVFENLDLLSQAPGVWCLTHLRHASIVGRWQTVQIQNRRHITKMTSDQVLRCCSQEIWIKNNAKNNTPKVVMSLSKRLKWETPFDMKCDNE